MGSSLALSAFIVGIGGLFFLNRDSSAVTSKALWIPVIWLWINFSRPMSSWLGISTPNASGADPASNSLDQLVAGALMLLGFIALLRRRREAMSLLRACWPIGLYFSYCLVSMLWSDFPAWGFKRWFRALGDLIMVLIIATDAQPAAALRRLFSRVGFVLIPTSILLIKYYPNLSVAYDAWGFQTTIGVAMDKNMLGVATYVLTLGAVWQVLWLLRDRTQPNRGRRLL